MVARRSARSQRIEALNQLRHLVFCGPEEVRARFKDRPKTGLVTEVAKLRPRKGSDPVLYTTQMTMRGLARRVQHLNAETKDLDVMLARTRYQHRSVVGRASTGSEPIRQPRYSWLQETTQTGSVRSGHGHTCVAFPQSQQDQAKPMAGTG